MMFASTCWHTCNIRRGSAFFLVLVSTFHERVRRFGRHNSWQNPTTVVPTSFPFPKLSNFHFKMATFSVAFCRQVPRLRYTLSKRQTHATV